MLSSFGIMEIGSKSEAVKVQFTTREGTYKQMPISEYFYPKRSPYVFQGPASTSTPVKSSFAVIHDGKEDPMCVCFTVGRELFYFNYSSIKHQIQPLEYLDKRTYKGVAPTCHDINKFSASADNVKVAVGFFAGQTQIIDVRTKESLQIMNEDRMIEKSRVTCVRWYPGSENILLSSHMNGCMYTYDINQPCANFIPQYHTQPIKSGEGYSIYTVKNKASLTAASNGTNTMSKNPLFKWVFDPDGSAVHYFSYSPCGRLIAIVTQSGYLHILDLNTFETHGCMKAYFGGILTCCWSPDGRYIVTGGEDDLVTVWSFTEKCVVARGHGHKSWISDVAFDPFVCVIPSDADMKKSYGISSVAECFSAESPKPCDDSANNNSSDKPAPSSGEERSDVCNGEVGLNAMHAMRRLRTYSNISKFSRLSIGADGASPSVCYRFGSVGQDAQLCLWEIDETTLFFSRKKRSGGSVRGTPLSEIRPLGGSSELTNGHHSGAESPATNPERVYRRGNNIPQPFGSASPHKDSKSAKHDGNNGVAPSKFATIATHHHGNKDTKEHKRNLSLPHFGIRTPSHQNGKTSSKYFHNKKNSHSHPIVPKTFGTVLCPRLNETTVLEPLVCKKISQGRMTCLDFLADCMITTGQDGYIQLWRRPNFPHEQTARSETNLSATGNVTTSSTVV